MNNIRRLSNEIVYNSNIPTIVVVIKGKNAPTELCSAADHLVVNPPAEVG